MLFYLAHYLSEFHSGFRVFQYLTLRAILAALTALVISFIIGPWMIRTLSSRQIGQRGKAGRRQALLRRADSPEQLVGQGRAHGRQYRYRVARGSTGLTVFAAATL